jgi:hypothetical protein
MKCATLVGRKTGAWRPVSMLPTQWAELAPFGQYYRHLLLQDTTGLARHDEFVQLPLGKIDADHVTVVRVDTPDEPIPAQLGYRFGDDAPQTRVVQFLADVEARGAARYLVLAGDDSVREGQPATDLKFQRRGAGGSWENSRVRIRMDTRSGQMAGVEHRGRRRGDSLKCRIQHVGPGYYNGIGEYSPRDWNKPTSEICRGPVSLLGVRQGLLPRQAAVHATVTYMLPARNPYLLVQTSLRFGEDVDSNTVFNDCCRYDHNEFTQASWKEQDGGVGKCCVFLPPEKKRSRNTRRTIVPELLDWLALANHADERVVAGLHLRYDCDGRPSRYKSRSDICAGAKAQWWMRFPVHGDCDEADERRYREMVSIKAGSVLRETTAYLFCPWEHSTGTDVLDGWFRRLTQPLRVVDVPL